jgi:archaetidylinositol phosphate synthase
MSARPLLLNRLRARLNGYFNTLGNAFGRSGLSPTAWTGVGFIVSLLAGYSFFSGGHAGALLGGLLVLASGFFDIVDGAVARATHSTSKRGAFLDSSLDRVSEVAIFLGIYAGGFAPAVLVILALSCSLLVSYTRARAEGLRAPVLGVGVGERGERLLALSAAGILGVTYYGVWLVLVLAAFTLGERLYRASASLPAKASPPATSTSSDLAA